MENSLLLEFSIHFLRLFPFASGIHIPDCSENKNSPLSSWTTFDSLFKPGKQGIVGKFNIKDFWE